MRAIILNPLKGVPDILSEELQWQPITEEEQSAGYVLRLHREFLNGGLQQAFSNIAAINHIPSTYCSAYQKLGLNEAYGVWQKANSLASLSLVSDDKWDTLDYEYERLTYGDKGDSVDLIEYHVVIYIQRHLNRFQQALINANLSYTSGLLSEGEIFRREPDLG